MPIYSDIDRKTDKVLIYDLPDINASIESILLTSKRERLFNPEFGSALEDYLFEIISDDTAFRILSLLVKAVEQWEPRVKLQTNQCLVEAEVDNHRYYLRLVYEVIGLEGQQFDYTGYLAV